MGRLSKRLEQATTAKPFADIFSIEESFHILEPQPYLTSHVFTTEKNLKLKLHVVLHDKISIRSKRTITCIMLACVAGIKRGGKWKGKKKEGGWGEEGGRLLSEHPSVKKYWLANPALPRTLKIATEMRMFYRKLWLCLLLRIPVKIRTRIGHGSAFGWHYAKVVMTTGYGKSVIYKMFVCAKDFEMDGHGVILVISALTCIIQDQLQEMESMGYPAVDCCKLPAAEIRWCDILKAFYVWLMGNSSQKSDFWFQSFKKCDKHSRTVDPQFCGLTVVL